MKDFIKKIVTRGYSLTDYVPVGIDQIKEKSFLQLDKNPPVDVTDHQFTLAYNPLVTGIVMSPQLYEMVRSKQSIIKLYFIDVGTAKKISEIYLKYYKIPDGWNTDKDVLVLFHSQRAYNYQLDYLRRSIILRLRYWNNKKAKKYFGTLPFVLHKQYAAQFSFPRKVALAVVRDGDFYSAFPIDLHGEVRAQNICAWGIRHSNKAVPHLKNSKKLLLADVPYTSYQAIYALGNFRSYKREENNGSGITISHTWQYVLPDFILGYREIELERFENIGSQCLFWGRILHEEVVKAGAALYHIHFIRFLQLQGDDKNTYISNHRH